MSLLGIGEVISAVGKAADALFTSDEERLKIALQEKAIEAGLVKGQQDINQVEAANPSVFVAGWRPAIGWIGAAALAYQFLLYPMLIWLWAVLQVKGWIDGGTKPPPVLDAQELFVIVTGMLGIAGLRSFDKFKGTDTKSVTGQ